MNPLDLAQKHFGQFRTKNDELLPMLCPFCNGGDHHDKYTFALNRHTGAYNCKRGSCGVQGSFRQLCEHFGEEADRGMNREYELRKPPAPIYKKPQTKMGDPDKLVKDYLAVRGFTEPTWRKRKVSGSGGNIVFPYYENGELVLVKFRPARKIEHGERKAWREEGGKPVFWGMDDCNPDLPLVIVEGEMDALTLEEAGIPNVVSVPSGAEDLTCVDNCWDWLQRFKRVIIWPDNDKPGLEMCRKLIQRLGAWRCSVVSTKHKDANVALFKGGKTEVANCLMNATEVPISGLIRLADVKAFDHENVVRVPSSIKGINQSVGGYMVGQISVWTGNPSSGKSTFLGQELLTAVDNGFKVCAYSGELPSAVFRYWIDLQAAGPQHIEGRIDSLRSTEKEKVMVWYPKRDVVNRIRNWYRNLFFLHDAFGCTTEDALLEVFTYAAMRYGCKVFLIDNLMTTDFSGSDRDFYRNQSAFVGRIVDFAQRYEAHVHLVAHPRKTEGKLSRQDISGSGDITNRAGNVFSLYRTPREERQGDMPAVTISVLKNRFDGKQDEDIELDFVDNCKRLYMRSEGSQWQYGWGSAADIPEGWDQMGHEVELDDTPF